MKNYTGNKYKNEILPNGFKFLRLTEDRNNINQRLYEYECIKCGTIIKRIHPNIVTAKCPKCREINHVGKLVNNFKIVEKIHIKNGSIYKAICEKCGNAIIKDFYGIEQLKGCKSCSKRERENKIFEVDIFGEVKYLTIIKKLEELYFNGEHQYLVRCWCGKEFKCLYYNLTNGSTRSCGCFRDSIVGDRHHNWNPNREEVEKRKNLHHIFIKMKYHLSCNCYKEYEDLMGEPMDKLLEYLNKFKLDWKDPSNHIDHIIPRHAFVKCGITDPKIVHNKDNLQVLTKFDNLSKGGKYNKKDLFLYLKKKYLENYVKTGKLELIK